MPDWQEAPMGFKSALNEHGFGNRKTNRAVNLRHASRSTEAAEKFKYFGRDIVLA